MKIKILLLSKNANLIKFLDQIYFVTKAKNIEDVFILLKENFHFIIIEDSLVDNFVHISKIKDQVNSYVILCGSIDSLEQNLIKTKFCDDFFVLPFAPQSLKMRLELLYNKKVWNMSEKKDFYNDELNILKPTLDIYINRIFLSVSSIANNDQIGDLMAYVKTIKLIHFIIYLMHTNSSYNEIYIEIENLCKSLLSIYNVLYEINFSENFSINALSYTTKKYFILIYALVLISCCGAIDTLKLKIFQTDHHVYIELSENLLDYNIFSNILLKKIFDKYDFITRDATSIAIQLKI